MPPAIMETTTMVMTRVKSFFRWFFLAFALVFTATGKSPFSCDDWNIIAQARRANKIGKGNHTGDGPSGGAFGKSTCKFDGSAVEAALIFAYIRDRM